MEREFSKPTTLALANPPWKRWARRLAVFALACVAAAALFFAARQFYRARQIRGMHEAAARFAADGNPGRAAEALARAHALDPKNEITVRLLIALWEGGSRQQELHWRTRLDSLAPQDEANLLAIARLGIITGGLGAADSALARLQSGPSANSPVLLNLRSARAALKGDWAGAAALAWQALEADPGNTEYQLNFARFATASGRPEDRAKSDRVLDALAADPARRPEALRIRRDRAMRDGAPVSALGFSDALVRDPAASDPDRIAHLTLLDAAGQPGAGAWLEQLMARAETDSGLMAALFHWLGVRGRHAEIVSWIARMPPDRAALQPVQLALINALDALKDWDEILRRFTDTPWGEPGDFLRNALVAKARRALAPADVSKWNTPWTRATLEALEDGQRALLLAQRASSWPGWERESEELLRAVIKRHPDQTLPALSLLTRQAQEQRRTRSLLEAAQLLHSAKPGDDRALNNALYYALLLGQSPEAIRRQADELGARLPDDPVVLSTRALALHLAGDSAGAAALLDRAGAAAEGPAVDALRAAVLFKTGREQEARALAARVDRAKLLPEEEALLRF